MKVCPSEKHEQLKREAWDQLELVGSMPTYNDEPGSPQTLELRNCQCGSTLSKELP